MRQKHFEEFFVCPYCECPLSSKAKLRRDAPFNYCTQCGEKIANAYAEALAQAESTKTP